MSIREVSGRAGVLLDQPLPAPDARRQACFLLGYVPDGAQTIQAVGVLEVSDLIQQRQAVQALAVQAVQRGHHRGVTLLMIPVIARA